MHNSNSVDKKVLRLKHILNSLEEMFPDPPAPYIFMPINRQILEEEVERKGGENSIAVENLETLNYAREFGLWNGTVKMFEAGSTVLKGTKFETKNETAGSALNYFIGLHSNVFVGTEISTYSNSLVTARLYRGNLRNYRYLPDGLHEWTPKGTSIAPHFSC